MKIISQIFSKFTKAKKPELIVKGSWAFKGDCPEDQVRKFFKDWEDGGYIYIDRIDKIASRNQTAWVARFSTSESNYKKFYADFGSFTSIWKGWDNPV